MPEMASRDHKFCQVFYRKINIFNHFNHRNIEYWINTFLFLTYF